MKNHDTSSSGSDNSADSEDEKKDGVNSGSESDSGSAASHSEKSDSNHADSNSENEDEENGVRRDENGENKDSEKGSDSNYEDQTSSNSSSDSSEDENSRSRSIKTSKSKKDRAWIEEPDLYGIRRSTRERKEPTRYTTAQNSDSDEHPGKRRGRKRKDSDHWDNAESDSGSSSDAYSPAQRRGPVRRQAKRSTKKTKSKGKKKGRSRKQWSSDESDSDDGRFVRRPGTKKVSYKEESDAVTESDDLIEMADVPEETESKETIEKVLAGRVGRKGATGSKTTSYNCEENDPNAGLDPENEETEPQYLIKWKGWAHIHNTFELEVSLREQKVNGLKRLENFKKREEEIDEWRSLSTPEDIEYFDLQQEMMLELNDQYKLAERIIIHDNQKQVNTNGYPDYLVKWQGLPYADCTWEDGELISKKYQSAIDEYYARNKSQRIPSKLCKVLKYRPKFAKVKDQPLFIGGPDNLQLRDYQLDAVNWLVHAWIKNNSAILADEMGLGKTIEVISFLCFLHETYQLYGPYLVVVPLSTLAAWQREFKLWAPQMNVVIYIGDVASRTKLREYEWCHPGNKRLKFNVIITTYEILLKDKSFLNHVDWSMLCVDEAHRLKNDDSLLYRTLNDFSTNHRLLITGTPLQNSLKELWSLLYFIMPEKIGTWAEFEESHSEAAKTGFTALHKQLEPYLIRRVKKDVEKSLPAKVEQILRVEMTSLQKQYYKWVLTKNYQELLKGVKGRTCSFVNIIMELKKCCNHASLTRSNEDPNQDRLQQLLRGSGKVILLDKLLRRLKDTGHRVLIFSQMVRMLDILAEYLELRHFNYQRLDGSMRGDIRRQAMDHFNAEGSQDFCFLLSTRAGGLGINLATADTVIIFDSDWNPQNDLQAQARAHRIGQKNQVCVYRLVTKKSVEEDIVERAKKKMVLDHLVIQRMDTTGRTVLNKGSVPSSSGSTPFNKEELTQILKFGAEELFKENVDDEEDPQVDIDEILKFAETHETDTNNMGDELLSQFKVVSIDNLEEEQIDSNENTMDGTENEGRREWDGIIPEDDRRRMDEEIRQQQLLELHLPPRQRKTIQQLQMEYDSDDNRRKKKKKYEDEDDSDASMDEDDDDDDRPKRRGRPKAGKDGVKGFTMAEVKRFVRSFKRFPHPTARLDAVAGDAELLEKPEADLRKMADLLNKSCDNAMAEYRQKLKDEPSTEGKKTHRGPTVKIANVMVNAQSVMKSIEDLEPLDQYIPFDKEKRKKYVIDGKVKVAHWDCPWDIEDDSNLLKGIYEYGMGNWESIKMDTELCLMQKILPDGNIKPQAKNLVTRVEYLLKVLRKDPMAPRQYSTNTSASARSKKKKPISKDIIDKDDSDSDSGPELSVKVELSEKPESFRRKKKVTEESDDDLSEGEIKEEKKKKKERKSKDKSKKKKDKDGPKHFTTSEPISIADEDAADNNLSAEVFAECKEKMRAVKKSLKQLSSSDEGLTEQQQIAHFRSCMLDIGDRINKCLSLYNDLDSIRTWRNNLWSFVSRFTSLDAPKLYKAYKKVAKKREAGGKDKSKSEKSKHEKHEKSKHKKEHHHSKKDKPARKPPEQEQGESRDSNGSTGSRPVASSTSHSAGHSNTFRNVLNQHNPTNEASRGMHSSPLARPDVPHKGYESANSYNRTHPEQRNFHGGERPYSGDHQRFNHDRRSEHTPNYNYRDYNNYQSYRQARPDNRGDYRPKVRTDQHGNEHYRPEYRDHYRDHAAPHDDHRSDNFQSHSERKRKPEDYYNRDKLSSKERRLDPRLDPRLAHDPRNTSYSSETQPSH